MSVCPLACLKNHTRFCVHVRPKVAVVRSSYDHSAIWTETATDWRRPISSICTHKLTASCAVGIQHERGSHRISWKGLVFNPKLNVFYLWTALLQMSVFTTVHVFSDARFFNGTFCVRLQTKRNSAKSRDRRAYYEGE